MNPDGASRQRWGTGVRGLRRHGTPWLVCALASLAVAGCSVDSHSIAGQAQRGDSKGYVAGNGAIESIRPGDRSQPVRLEGKLLDGSPWKIDDHRDKVVVINVWGSWCAPCEAEMPRLEKAWSRWRDSSQPVVFVGIDSGESAETGAAAVKRYGLTYPSLSDQNRTLTLGLQGKANATPTTLVIDRQGRIAARISGEVTSESTLVGLVEDVLKET
ncbi:TlpA family protein disulfide reductase [Austwickia chelonae]|uniref:TlpA family protein disulfide reductase n=1 Tax=Austwickia chelonae TaxID=100225 RepID=UPI000E232EB0|nr:TlpA disulfide reductase family protein [Austwickia chelonae]